MPCGLAALALLVGGGCAWKVIPPSAEGDTIPVFVTSYNKTSRLALPADPPRLVEFGFGDWHYYALEERGFASTIRAALFSPAATLCRRELPWSEDPEVVRRRSGGEATIRIDVDASLAAGLLNELEGLWDSLAEPRHYREREDLTLARWDDVRYTVFRNSNHLVVAWLQDLGCEVRGWSLLNRFHIVETEATETAPPRHLTSRRGPRR